MSYTISSFVKIGQNLEEGLSTSPEGEYFSFSTINDVGKHLDAGDSIADVEIPKDAVIITDDAGNQKASQIILTNIRPVKEHPLWTTESICDHIYMDMFAYPKMIGLFPSKYVTLMICHYQMAKKNSYGF